MEQQLSVMIRLNVPNVNRSYEQMLKFSLIWHFTSSSVFKVFFSVGENMMFALVSFDKSVDALIIVVVDAKYL